MLCVLCLVKYQWCEYSHTFLFSLQLGNCNTPLQLASKNGHSAAVDTLLSHGAAVNQLSGVSQLCSVYAVPKDLWVVSGCTDLLPSCPSHSPCALLLISHYQHIVQLFELAACHIYIDVPPVVGCRVCRSELFIVSRKGYHYIHIIR